MALPHSHPRAAWLALVMLALTLGLMEQGLMDQAAAEEPALQSLRAPFACETEWAGTTRSGHGLNNWNLDLNRTSRTFSDPQHDLGQPLLAQADGTVVWIGWHVSAGTYVEIDYGDITVRYIHLVDDSVPGLLAVGSRVVEGQQFGELGDTGNATHAHLHLEYFDSRSYDDARAYLLPASNQIQIAMDSEPIDPGETFVSTNCDGDPPPSSSTSSTTTTTEPPHPFGDVDPDSFAYDDIALIFDLGITTGTSATTYSPADPVDREQMAAFLARLHRLHNPNETALFANNTQDPPLDITDPPHPFGDVDPDSFAYDDIALIFDLGITTGTSATTYSPADPVDREQMAAFLARLHRLHGPLNPDDTDPDDTDPDNTDPDNTGLAELTLASIPDYPFGDVDPDSFAYDDIAAIFDLGITTGTSATTYSPADPVDREQMAAFLARLHRLIAST